MSNLDDRLRHALRDLDHRVAGSLAFEPTKQRTRARHPAIRVLVPVLAAIAVIAVLLGTGILGGAQDNSAPSGPTPTPSLVIPTTEGPSQTEEQARFDDIYPAVAELPLSQRVGELIAPAVSTPEGFWVLSRPVFPSRPTLDDDGCLKKALTAPTYRLCSLDEYSELLLLSSDSSKILRAFPQPGGVASQQMISVQYPGAADWFEVTPEAVYCGYSGPVEDESFATLCRVDRETLELEGIALTCGSENEQPGDCMSIIGRFYAETVGLPGSWVPGPILEDVAGIQANAAGELQLVDSKGEPLALLTTTPRFLVKEVLD